MRRILDSPPRRTRLFTSELAVGRDATTVAEEDAGAVTGRASARALTTTSGSRARDARLFEPAAPTSPSPSMSKPVTFSARLTAPSAKPPRAPMSPPGLHDETLLAPPPPSPPSPPSLPSPPSAPSPPSSSSSPPSPSSSKRAVPPARMRVSRAPSPFFVRLGSTNVSRWSSCSCRWSLRMEFALTDTTRSNCCGLLTTRGAFPATCSNAATRAPSEPLRCPLGRPADAACSGGFGSGGRRKA